MNLTTMEERRRRLTAGRKAWQALRGFWSKELPKDIKRMAFTGLVAAVSLTGLTATAPTQEDTRELDSFFLGCGRRMMRGAACIKEAGAEGGDLTYRAVPNEDVWKSLSRVSCAEELRIQRLKWFQAMTEHADDNCNLLAALFGDIAVLKHRPLSGDGDMNEHTPKMVRQLMQDLWELRSFDAGGVLWERLEGKPLRLFTDEETGELFRAIDVTQIRVRRLTREVAPTREEQPQEGGWAYRRQTGRRGETTAEGGTFGCKEKDEERRGGSAEVGSTHCKSWCNTGAAAKAAHTARRASGHRWWWRRSAHGAGRCSVRWRLRGDT